MQNLIAYIKTCHTHYTKCLDRFDKISVPEDLKELFSYHRQLTYVLSLKA